MDKDNVQYVHNRILPNHKKHEILSFMTTWTGLEDIILSNTIQAQKNKTSHDFTHK
jgi:hypothetical protein